MIEHNKYKSLLVVLLILIVAVGIILVSRVTYAYLARIKAEPGITTGTIGDSEDELIFRNTKGLSIIVNSDNFKLSDGNLITVANPTATLIANKRTKSATKTYNSGIIINKNTFVKTNEQAELLLTVKKNDQEITACGDLVSTTVNDVKGFDITGRLGTFVCATDEEITSTNTDEGVTDTWTYTVTFINKDYDQVANETAEFDATVILQEEEIYSLVTKLRANDSNQVLSKELVGGMYRYQGLDKQYKDNEESNPDNLPIVDNNYICFGTDKKEACLADKDKYMYRIIGVTETNELKLIKEVFLKEDGEIIKPQWNNLSTLSSPYDGQTGDCDGDKCEWPNSLLFKRLNGISNGSDKGNGTCSGEDNSATGSNCTGGTTNLFINSQEYDYLNNGSSWYNIIANHDWMYGDVKNGVYDGNYYYEIEIGKNTAERNWLNIGDTKETLIPYTWTKSINAKIGLQYHSDYLLGYPGGNPSDKTPASKSWIFYINNSENKAASDEARTNELFMLRHGASSGYVMSVCTTNTGNVSFSNLSRSTANAVRPVFYLTNTIKLSGTGIEDNPYLINLD